MAAGDAARPPVVVSYQGERVDVARKRGVKRGAASDETGTLQYQYATGQYAFPYPDLDEPGISQEELERRRRETRRMRNRESAIRSRLRRKQNHESLEAENNELRCEIEALRRIVGIYEGALESSGGDTALPDELNAVLNDEDMAPSMRPSVAGAAAAANGTVSAVPHGGGAAMALAMEAPSQHAGAMAATAAAPAPAAAHASSSAAPTAAEQQVARASAESGLNFLATALLRAEQQSTNGRKK